MTGDAFTLNNYGVFGVDRLVDKPWVVNGATAVRKVNQLSLSFDRRMCDGAICGGFLCYVAHCAEQPAVLLADL